VQGARHRGRVLAGKQHAHCVGRAAPLARGEHAADRRPALGKGALQRLTALGNRGGLGARLADFRLQRGERAVGLRNGALGLAQRVARFLAGIFLLLELLRQGPDARTKRGEVFFFRGMGCGCRREGEGEDQEPIQALAFPWADTAAMRFWISVGSPR
jgi:hypothetical protein